jgi:hypothetical protein
MDAKKGVGIHARRRYLMNALEIANILLSIGFKRIKEGIFCIEHDIIWTVNLGNYTISAEIDSIMGAEIVSLCALSSIADIQKTYCKTFDPRDIVSHESMIDSINALYNEIAFKTGLRFNMHRISNSVRVRKDIVRTQISCDCVEEEIL